MYGSKEERKKKKPSSQDPLLANEEEEEEGYNPSEEVPRSKEGSRPYIPLDIPSLHSQSLSAQTNPAFIHVKLHSLIPFGLDPTVRYQRNFFFTIHPVRGGICVRAGSLFTAEEGGLGVWVGNKGR